VEACQQLALLANELSSLVGEFKVGQGDTENRTSNTGTSLVGSSKGAAGRHRKAA